MSALVARRCSLPLLKKPTLFCRIVGDNGEVIINRNVILDMIGPLRGRERAMTDMSEGRAGRIISVSATIVQQKRAVLDDLEAALITLDRLSPSVASAHLSMAIESLRKDISQSGDL
jgi:hypothetical protein